MSVSSSSSGSSGWMNISAQQTSDAGLELAILGCVNTRIDTAVHEHHHDGEVIEPGGEVHSAAEETHEAVDHVE